MKKLAMSESDEEDVRFENISSRRKTNRIIIITLTVVLLLLFILCVIFIVLFALEKSKVHKQVAQETPPPLQKICGSRKCLLTAIGKFNFLLSRLLFFRAGLSSQEAT